ncbi:hypothetical protein DNG35_05475 [Mesonia sp. K7]|nr:hypothetical protein DNG35_05475 [Mesonia sp. K7]
MSNIYFLTILIAIGILYSLKFYMENRKVIEKIKFGKVIYLLQNLTGASLALLVYYKKIDWIFFFLILPVFIASSVWFYFQYYRLKESKQELIYVGCLYLMIFLVFIK